MAQAGDIYTIAGAGEPLTGDGGPATAAGLASPVGIAAGRHRQPVHRRREQ